MAATDLPRVFERFYKARSRNRGSSGPWARHSGTASCPHALRQALEAPSRGGPRSEALRRHTSQDVRRAEGAARTVAAPPVVAGCSNQLMRCGSGCEQREQPAPSSEPPCQHHAPPPQRRATPHVA